MSDLQIRKQRVIAIKDFSTYLKVRKTGSLVSGPSANTNNEDTGKTRSKKKKRRANLPIVRVP